MSPSAPRPDASLPATPAARDEWRAAWPVPVVAMIGVSGCSIFPFASGVLLADITREFGRTRAAFASAYTFQMLFSLIAMPAAGWLVGRIGARTLALVGAVFFVAANAALAFASGDIGQWRALSIVQLLGTVAVSPVVWIAMVIERFNAARGLAIAVALSGIGLAVIIWPPLAALSTTTFGWRPTYGILALGWAVVTIPLTLALIPRRRQGPLAPDAPTGPRSTLGDFARDLRSRTFLSLLVAGCLVAFVTVAFNIHVVPILQANGFALLAAAQIAGVGGIAALAGSLTTGFVLDRLPAHRVGLIVFAMPALGALVMLAGKGSAPISILATLSFGLASGAELNMLAYIASRQLARARFAPAYALMQAAITVVASLGPLVAGALYDRVGDYRAYLLLSVPLSALAALVVWSIPDGGREDRA